MCMISRVQVAVTILLASSLPACTLVLASSLPACTHQLHDNVASCVTNLCRLQEQMRGSAHTSFCLSLRLKLASRAYGT